MWARRTQEAGAQRTLRYRHEHTKHCTLQALLFMYHIPYKYHPYRLPIQSVRLERDAVQSGTCITALQNELATNTLQIHALQTTRQNPSYITQYKNTIIFTHAVSHTNF